MKEQTTQQWLYGQFALPCSTRSLYMAQADLQALVCLLTAFRCRTVLEIGAHRGGTAKAVLQACPFIQAYIGIDVPAAHVPTLGLQRDEIPPDGEGGRLAADEARYSHCEITGGSQSVAGYASAAPELWQSDAVIIDGDHGTACVEADTAFARTIARRLIVWHDADLWTVEGVLAGQPDAVRVIGTKWAVAPGFSPLSHG